MSDLLQVVVVSSGTNDWHSLPPMYDLEEWVAQAVAFLREVSTALMARDATFLSISYACTKAALYHTFSKRAAGRSSFAFSKELTSRAKTASLILNRLPQLENNLFCNGSLNFGALRLRRYRCFRNDIYCVTPCHNQLTVAPRWVCFAADKQGLQ